MYDTLQWPQRGVNAQPELCLQAGGCHCCSEGQVSSSLTSAEKCTETTILTPFFLACSGLMHWCQKKYLLGGLPAAAAGAVGGSPEPLQGRFLVWALLRTTRGDVLAWDLRVGLHGLKFVWTVTCLSCSSADFSLNPLCHTLLVPHWVSWAHFLLKYILCLQCCRCKSSFYLYKNKLVPLYSVCNNSFPHAP